MEINLSHHWHKIQTFLFPRLEEELGPMTSKHHQLITTIELARVEDVINTRYNRIGRPLGNRKNIAHAYIAKAIYNLPTTASIIERLHSDSKMRQICGWSSKYDIPSESTFSRAFAEFSETSLATRIHVNNQINSPGNYHQNSPGAIQKNLISFSPPGHRFSRYF